jgi:CheY-like chemotaxis protein
MSKKLLLADDSVTIQKVIQITFAHEDYDLTITDNGDTALQKARELKPDLVLADVYMPGKNGYELCTALKQDPVCRSVPVLLLAGSFEPFDEDKARAAKADGWLEKPFESQTLIDKVAELLAISATAAGDSFTVPEPEEAAFSGAESAPAGVEEDVFGAVSFAEEPSPEAAVPVAAAADDWSDLGEFAAGDESAAAGEDFAFEEDVDVEETVAANEEMFVFEDKLDEGLPSADVNEPEQAGEEEEEVMALDDDDILDFEDLEPLEEDQTLAAWSRDDFAVGGAGDALTPFDEISGEASSEEEPLAAAEGFAPPVEPVSPAAEPVFDEKQADVQTVTGVEQKVAVLSDAEIEAIVERVAGKVIEKLAGTILERVAWEVVPDLAESLIKDEINKIKEAAA